MFQGRFSKGRNKITNGSSRCSVLQSDCFIPISLRSTSFSFSDFPLISGTRLLSGFNREVNNVAFRSCFFWGVEGGVTFQILRYFHKSREYLALFLEEHF